MLSATHGHLRNPHGDCCEVTCSYMELLHCGENIPGRWYGQVKWLCNNSIGSLISPYQGCDDGITLHNFFIHECRPTSLLFVLGLISALLCHLILTVIVKGILSTRFFRMKLEKMISHINGANDTSYTGRVKKTEVAFMMETISNKDWKNLDKHSQSLLHKRGHNVVRVKTAKSCVPFYVSRTVNRVGYFLFKLFLVLHLVREISACSNFPVQKGSVEMCHGFNCTLEYTLNSLLRPHDSLCYKSRDGKFNVERKLILVNEVLTYTPIYKTFDYAIDTLANSVCEGSSGCWKSMPSCIGMNSPFAAEDYFPTLQSHRSPVNGTFCDRYSDDCVGHVCGYPQMCHFGYWRIKTIGTPSFVYRYSGKYWEVVMNIIENGVSRVMTFTIILSNTKIHDSIFTVAPSFVGSKPDCCVLTNNKVIYGSTCSDVNRPVPNMIGDLQMAIMETTEFIHHSQVQCGTGACKMSCSTSSSAVSRLTGYDKIDDDFTMLGETLAIRRPFSGVVHMTVKTEWDPIIKVEPGNCEIEIKMVKMCVDCVQLPRIVYEIRSVEVNGVMDVKSNCSLVDTSIDCGVATGELRFLDRKRLISCLVTTPYKNYTGSGSGVFHARFEHMEVLSHTSYGLKDYLISLKLADDVAFLSPIFANFSIWTLLSSVFFAILLLKKL